MKVDIMKVDISEVIKNKNILPNFKQNLIGERSFCDKLQQDWVNVVSGGEGGGKSTLSLEEAVLFNPNFNPKEHGAWNLKQFIELSRKYRKEPHTIIFLDEAANLFLSKESAAKSNIILVKLFISNRSFQHHYILNIPSIFWLEKYIREFRIRSLNYVWIDWKNIEDRWFAFYSKQQYLNILMDSKKARLYTVNPTAFVRMYRPNFVEKYVGLQGDLWDRYIECKEKFQVDLLDEAYEECLKLEEAKKIGFNDNLNPNEFFVWLWSHFNVQNSFTMKFSKMNVAAEAMIERDTASILVDNCVRDGFIYKIDRYSYMVTDKGKNVLLGKPDVVDSS